MLKKNLDEALTVLNGSGANTVEHVLVAIGDSDSEAVPRSAVDIHLETV